MIKGNFPLEQLKSLPTPFYYYDVELLKQTLATVKDESSRHGYQVHYAVKANRNPRILSIIAEAGFGADCVSGGEIQSALEAGIPAEKIVYAGVGKADWEIVLGLEKGIYCFNVESEAEIKVINEIAGSMGKVAPVALRINPEIDAHTHSKITTGMKENKFGINLGLLNDALDLLQTTKHVHLSGIHFHIGSQITDISAFQALVIRANEIQDELESRRIKLEHVNFGGGLGINYHHPNHVPVADFKTYFDAISALVELRPGQQAHFEPGRSIIAQCGTLISRVLYVKEGETKTFVILDAGFTDLIRPAMYDAYHRIENLTSEDEAAQTYDVVGPVCESADVFAQGIELNTTRRGDLIAIRSAGAYGEAMASQYNGRRLPAAYFSDTL
ncbi:MAG: diaminopimelate decarboxylase [Tannerellaceae bacterium]|jgi:diaminopimelate decarboxylase|nr:diaminopimelate decarboxylase [Tannerellaceae bacterium]